jgi:hypothetical protein
MLRPRQVQTWRTARLPRDIAEGDRVLFWESAPHLHVVGIGEVGSWERDKDVFGNAHFWLVYQSPYINDGPTADELRKEPLFANASFLKTGPAVTLYSLTDEQAGWMAQRLAQLDESVLQAWPDLFTGAGASARQPKAVPEKKAGQAQAKKESAETDVAEPASEPGRGMRALSIRQPWAELIMSGKKKVEYRSRRTNIRERVYIYAGEGRYSKDDEEEFAREYKLDMDSLPRGVLVGTVEIVGCDEGDDGFEWKLSKPERAEHLRQPKNHPQPGFFYPF